MRRVAIIICLSVCASQASAQLLEMPSGTYDCEAGQVKVIEFVDGKANVSTVTAFPLEMRQFQIHFGTTEAYIDWPNSYVDASGAAAMLPTGASSGMLLTVGKEPCRLTGNPCAAMVNFGRQSDGSLKLLITPTAVSSADELDGSRAPLLVSIDGRCTEVESR